MVASFARVALACGAALALTACDGGRATAQAPDGYGANPQLPKPHKKLIPTVNIAPAKGWPDGGAPTAAPGFQVSAFARDLAHPRWIYVLPNGDVLVAETNGPGEPVKGLKAWVQKLVMKNAGAQAPSANRITLLRDADGDGAPELRTVFLQGLTSPFGMALVGDSFYVADTDALLRFPYTTGQTTIAAPPAKVTDLPGGPIDHHWTKNVIASPDGAMLYVTVGSNSNVGENGIAAEKGRAAIWQVDPKTGAHREFATGLRNPNGLGWQPQSGALWTAVNERDEIGDDLVPDYITSVRDGAFYGWPYSYYGGHVDKRVKPQRPDLVAKAIAPDYALGSHTASLGLAFHDGVGFPAGYAGGAFVGQHGSWNRSEPAGYKVIFVPFRAGMPAGTPRDFLTGFLNAKGDAQGRPVGVAEAKDGALLVADDVGDVIWRVTPSARPAAPAS